MKLLSKYLLLILPSLFLLPGCSTLQKKELSRSSSEKFRNSVVAYAEREFPNLEVYSTADVGGGPITFLVGAILVPGYTDDPDDTEINNQIQSSHIGNPHALFQKEILKHLKNHFDISIVGSAGIIPTEVEDEFEMDQFNSHANFILNTSIRWKATYLPMKMTRFRFHINFEVQLCDESGGLIYRDKFVWITPRELGFPTMKQFVNNREIGIEAQLKAAMAEAVNYFKTKLN